MPEKSKCASDTLGHGRRAVWSAGNSLERPYALDNDASGSHPLHPFGYCERTYSLGIPSLASGSAGRHRDHRGGAGGRAGAQCLARPLAFWGISFPGIFGKSMGPDLPSILALWCLLAGPVIVAFDWLDYLSGAGDRPSYKWNLQQKNPQLSRWIVGGALA